MNDIDKKKLTEAFLSSFNGKFKESDIDGAVNRHSAEQLVNRLSPSEKAKLNDALSNKESMEQILNSPQAKALMKSLFKGRGSNG